ncbi:MAG: CapA family protein [Gemmatimonadota bacterium]
MGTGRSITLGAVGDIGYVKGVSAGAGNHGLDWSFDLVRPHLHSVDILFGNLECVLRPPGYPVEDLEPRTLVAPFPGPEIAEALVRAGFTFINLAHNHILDAGVVGMQYTREVLESAGLVTGGVGRSQEEARRLVTIRRNGLTVGLLCYCEDNNYVLGTRGPCHAFYERDTVLADVVAFKDRVDVLVVSVHADLECTPAPSPPRLEAFRAIAEAGAHIVLGHHPHVPQGCEIHGASLIAYSLGNFLFPVRTSSLKNHAHAGESFLLKVKVGADGIQGFERLPVEIRGDHEERPVPVTGADAEALLEYFHRLDAHLDDEEFLRDTWRAVARRKLGLYLAQAVTPPGRSTFQRGIRRLLKRMGLVAEPDVDRVIGELVARLCVTQENRLWMEEVLQMGMEEKEKRLSVADADPYHRPHFHFGGR